MKNAHLIKVTVALVISVAIFYLGTRYFESMPLFRGNAEFFTELDHAGGLIPGHAVRMRGVTVGQVKKVTWNPATNSVRVTIGVDNAIPIPLGTTAHVGGFDALGVVQLDLRPGPDPTRTYAAGSEIPGPPKQPDLFSSLTAEAPALLARLDSALTATQRLMRNTDNTLNEPNGAVQASLTQVSSAGTALTNLLNSQKEQLSSTLESIELLSRQLAANETDSLDGAVDLAETSLRIRNTLSAIDASLQVLDETLAPLSIMLERINAGEGTLGRLAVDESLYVNADSTLAAAHRLLVGFEQNPKRYLEDLKLFSLF